jgi:ribosomal protein S12 methylthiotransferase
MPEKSRATWTCRCSTSTKTCSNGCAAKPRSNTSWIYSKIRAGVPGIALRTTFIVGFPGETEASFQTLLDFIRETKFERLGVFTYSQEDGTRAGAMAGQISDKVKQKRRELAMAAQHKSPWQVSESFVGREIKVLVEGGRMRKQFNRRTSVRGNTA